jgi:hypothetical protein
LLKNTVNQLEKYLNFCLKKLVKNNIEKKKQNKFISIKNRSNLVNLFNKNNEQNFNSVYTLLFILLIKKLLNLQSIKKKSIFDYRNLKNKKTFHYYNHREIISGKRFG